MSNIKKCARRECNKEINIEKDAFFTIQLSENRGKEYHCFYCGMGIAEHFYNEGSINLIKDCFKYISREGEEHSGEDFLAAFVLLEKYGPVKIRAMMEELEGVG